MAAKAIARQIEKLRKEISHHEELYYVHDSPEISDREYDKLLEELQRLEQEYPELLTPDSPTQRVGGRPAEGFAKVVHSRAMMSLDNSYNIDELRAFDDRCRRLAEGRPLDYVAELKIVNANVFIRAMWVRSGVRRAKRGYGRRRLRHATNRTHWSPRRTHRIHNRRYSVNLMRRLYDGSRDPRLR